MKGHVNNIEILVLFWCWIIWRDVATHIKKYGTTTNVFGKEVKTIICNDYGVNFDFSCPCCQYMITQTKGPRYACIGSLCLMSSVWKSKISRACIEHYKSPYNHYICRDRANISMAYNSALSIAEKARVLYLKACNEKGIKPLKKDIKLQDDSKTISRNKRRIRTALVNAANKI